MTVLCLCTIRIDTAPPRKVTYDITYYSNRAMAERVRRVEDR